MTEPQLAGVLAGWAPEPAEATETIAAEPAVALAGLFDVDPPVTGNGDPIPPLWHWLYFLDRPAQRDLGPDGHPADGRFMPPIPRRRRMYAGGRVSYLSPLRCGESITRRSELADWTIKQGRTGELLFVTVRHTFLRAGEPVATEEQDLVYRSAPPDAPGTPAVPPPVTPLPVAPPPVTPPPATPPPATPQWLLEVVADPVLLFRFSALTYNAHRIHYDAAYASAVEGHPGLVVHGPLLAMLCLELPRRQVPGPWISRVSFRARAAVYAGVPFGVTGSRRDGGCEMRVTAADGTTAMTAEAHIEL
jgi:hydroxyacyl-ACP dehydratase HTD2-like protein with hotdog domain